MSTLLLVVILLVLVVGLLYRLAKEHLWLIFGGPQTIPNPFKEPARKRKGVPLVTNTRDRDKVLKQSFSVDKIPKDIDAIVIGSGIGGLSVAAILSKLGKKVLVLEQHDQAGGCCHTFIEKGYEFDVGIHYIGEMAEGTLSRVFLDQLTESGIEWHQLEEVYDTVVLGLGDDNPSKRRSFPIPSGRKKLMESLIKRFPSEEKMLYKYFDILKRLRGTTAIMSMLKLLPRSITRFFIRSGVFMWMFPVFQYYQKSLRVVLDELTDNKELKAVLAYSYGDYGTVPKEASFAMQALLTNHFTHGGYYPVGGASELAFNIIPTIEASGGRVLVRAAVTDIVMDDAHQRVVGVKVKQGHTVFEIIAPVVISDAGLMNTVKTLLPSPAVKRYGLKKSLLSRARHGLALMSVFVGLDGTKEEFDLEPSNIWAFTDENLDECIDKYLHANIEDVGQEVPPLMFLSFPSTKDPTYDERYPGKSTCAIITATPYEWFKQWKEEKALHRSKDYEDFKNSIAEKLWCEVIHMYPQLEGRREYFEVGSPLTNIFYLGTQKGEVYGVDHDTERFSVEAMASLRPDIGVPGLYLTGQDVFTCGFSGAMYGGLLCAMTITKRNLMNDLITLTQQTKRELRAKKD